MIFITGGAGFIGSNFVQLWLRTTDEPMVNLDKLSYAGSKLNLKPVEQNPRHIFIHGDIGDRETVRRLLEQYSPRAIINFAAESHVDRSISSPGDFIQTNIVGTFHLLEEARNYFEKLEDEKKKQFRFMQISTDEVFGDLTFEDAPFVEHSRYRPSSPYSASKASADHLVRAYHRTFGLPTLICHSCNNYGPHQYPEKLIPKMLLHAEKGEALPLYGDGLHIRDWIYVEDNCRALQVVLEKGVAGESYNVGANEEKSNMEVVKAICAELDLMRPTSSVVPHHQLIRLAKDRPGHDRRYAINASRLRNELGWSPKETFSSGIRKTIHWYLENSPCRAV